MNNTAYDFSLFETHTAPAAVPEKETAAKPVLLPKKKKSRQQERVEAALVAKKTLKVLSLTLCIAFFVGTYIFASMRLDEINHDITQVERDIKVANSENTRLRMELGAMASLDKVEDYAINKLGMVKQEGYQVQYIDLAMDDKVVLANGAAPGETDEKDGTLDKLLSYFR